MGLIDKLFPKSHERVPAGQYFKLISGYAPVFRTWDGQLYESELVRSAIDARSRHISKLEIESRRDAAGVLCSHGLIPCRISSRIAALSGNAHRIATANDVTLYILQDEVGALLFAVGNGAIRT